jgi:pimeloyl-ACP methyl ester carboxylesterase
MPKAELPECKTHRDRGKDAAIIFVHGYGGHPEKTWGKFPEYLMAHPGLDEWDVYSLGYHTSLAPDVLRSLWKANPALDTLGDLLWTMAGLPPLDRYQALAIVGHSMGGLVVQHALLNADFRRRVQHVFLFGTPSAGLRKASVMSFWKRQLRDMAEDGHFVRTLRARWSEEVGKSPPFLFWPIGGDEDEFVPRESSVDPFGKPFRIVPGDHLSIVKPRQPESLSVQMVLNGLTTGTAPHGPLESARVAVERRKFKEAIEQLGPRAAELDADALVMLALALDGAGKREQAVRVLQERGDAAGTDVLGTLGGRIKRRWVGERRQSDAELALSLYAHGHELATARNDHEQAYYHAINLAFLALLYGGDVPRARTWAADALRHCADQEARLRAENLPDKDALWRAATRGEALLVEGRTEEALAEYRRAVKRDPQPDTWQALSMYWQGRLVAEELGDKRAVKELDALFGLAPEVPR